jgi:hypothetical protein
MDQSIGTAAIPQPSQDDAGRKTKVRRFAIGVSIVLMVVCNAVLLFGVRASGVNLDELVKTPDLFNAKQDICLRLSWQSLAGAAEPIRLCSEWINLSDPSGKTHQIQKDTKLRQGPDGQYYVDRGIQADYRLLMLVLFVVAVIAFGLTAKWYLVSRYRLHLETAAGHRASLVH